MRTNAAIVQQPVGQSPWDLTGRPAKPQTIAMFHRPSHSGPTIDRKPQCCRANAIPRRTTERSRLTHWQTPQFRNRTWPEHDGCAHNGRSAADRGIRIHCLALGGVDLTSAAGCANQATAGRSAPAIEWRGKRGKPRETLRHAPPNDHAGSRFDQVARNLVVRASNHLVKLDQTKRQHQIVQRRQSFPGQGKSTTGKLRVRVAVLAVETPPRFAEAVRILDDPGPAAPCERAGPFPCRITRIRL